MSHPCKIPALSEHFRTHCSLFSITIHKFELNSKIESMCKESATNVCTVACLFTKVHLKCVRISYESYVAMLLVCCGRVARGPSEYCCLTVVKFEGKTYQLKIFQSMFFYSKGITV